MVNDFGNFGMFIFIAIITAFIVQIVMSYLTLERKRNNLKRGKHMEKRKKEIKIVIKLISSLKTIGFYLKLIFWVIIIPLSLGVALAFICDEESDYKSDEEQMREWMENKECE